MDLATKTICCGPFGPPSLGRQLVQTAEFLPCVASPTRVTNTQELGHLIPTNVVWRAHQPEEVLT